MALPLNDRIQYTREAGNVARCHLIPHAHGTYTDASHSWHAAMLLMHLNPLASLTLVYAVLTHDLGERIAGDVPLTARRQAPEIQLACEALEAKAMLAYAPRFSMGNPELTPMSNNDMCWLQAVDMLEFFLWCEDELAGGNRHAKNAWTNIVDAIEKRIAAGGFPEAAKVFFVSYQWKRMEDYLP